MNILKAIIRFLLETFAPVIAVGIGAVIAGTGFSAGSSILLWTGIAIIGAGVLWGLLIYGGADLS